MCNSGSWSWLNCQLNRDKIYIFLIFFFGVVRRIFVCSGLFWKNFHLYRGKQTSCGRESFRLLTVRKHSRIISASPETCRKKLDDPKSWREKPWRPKNNLVKNRVAQKSFGKIKGSPKTSRKKIGRPKTCRQKKKKKKKKIWAAQKSFGKIKGSPKTSRKKIERPKTLSKKKKKKKKKFGRPKNLSEKLKEARKPLEKKMGEPKPC